VIVAELRSSAADFAARTGWVAKPEGLCKGAMCVPLPAGAAADELDLSVVAERLGMPVLHDEAHGVYALGPATVSGRALDTAEVPDITLPDLEGRPFSLSSLRGKRVVVFAWASW
jgi:hypothetical protein